MAATETTAYTPFGEVDHTVDLNGTKVDNTYDYQPGSGLTTALGRVAKTTWTLSGHSTPDQSAGYTYDPLGRRATVTDAAAGHPDRVTAYAYDADGRTTAVTAPEGTVGYEYDPVTGRPTAMTTGQTRVDYAYDLLGRLLTVTESARAGVALAAADRLVTAYGYDPVGDVTAVTVTQGGTAVRATTNAYDPERHWLQSVTNKVAGGAVASTFAYQRRADGQVSQVTDTTAQPGGGSQTQTITYTYDALDRLTTETESGGTIRAYTLDLVGNRTRLDVTAGGATTTTTSTYDARDRLLTEATGGVTITSGYDAAGSLTSQTGGGQPATYTYDARGRLAGATVAGATASYAYTADGVRSSVTDGSGTTRYLIDGQSPSGYAQVVEERQGGNFVASYVYGAGLDPLSMSRDTGGGAGVQPVLYLADGHSGVRQVATPGGAVLLVQRFDGFGNTVAQSNPSNLVNPIGYRGERWDRTLGNYVLRARLYDPASGRFTSQYPFAGTYGDPLQLMRYGYAGANPIANSDPSGMEFSLGGLATGIAGITALSIISLPLFTTVRKPGLWGFVPVVGSAWEAAYNFQEGKIGWGLFYSAMAVLDVFLIRSLVSGAVRLTTKLGETGAKELAAESGVTVATQPWRKFPGVRVAGGEHSRVFVKEVDPAGNAFARAWGRISIEAQVYALEKMGPQAPRFYYNNGVLITENVGKFSGGFREWLAVYTAGSWRLGTVLNDIMPRNIGANGMVFDPVKSSLDDFIQWLGLFLLYQGSKGVTADG